MREAYTPRAVARWPRIFLKSQTAAHQEISPMQRKNIIIALFCLASLITVSASAQSVTPPIVPNPAKTPGDVLDVKKEDICVPGYAKKVRNVPEDVKKKAYAEYGI